LLVEVLVGKGERVVVEGRVCEMCAVQQMRNWLASRVRGQELSNRSALYEITGLNKGGLLGLAHPRLECNRCM